MRYAQKLQCKIVQVVEMIMEIIYKIGKRHEKAFRMLTLLVVLLILTPSIRIMENLLEVQSEKINKKSL